MAPWIQGAFSLRQALAREDTLTLASLLALVYRRVGWEMGTVKRSLENHRINWGYFFDHNPFEPHCNAHPNNYIALPPVSLTVHNLYILFNIPLSVSRGNRRCLLLWTLTSHLRKEGSSLHTVALPINRCLTRG